ncbi:MAG: HdeD family acid-resistance protein [Xanthobacteraceae bacterium]|nr:MAG: HdeD family acid-resistance protein [Xanthobacteraceae bacterium]
MSTTTVEYPGGTPMLHALARVWWLVLLRGIASVIFGILAFLWPGLTLLTLVVLYGAFAVADGVLALIATFTGRAKPMPTWWLAVAGLAGVASGLIALILPGLTAVVLVMLIGAWALVHGVFEIVGAIKLRKEIDNEWWLILAGVLSALFGLVVLIAPGAGALGLIWAIAAYSVAFGCMLIGLSFRLRRHRP